MARTKPPLKLRRGTQAEITAAFAANPADFAEGEPVYATDTGKLYIKNAAGTLDEISGSAPGSGNGVWGQITGTLSAQTDLQSALDAKVELADLPQNADGSLDLAKESTLTDFISEFPTDPATGNLDIAQESTLLGYADRLDDVEQSLNLNALTDGDVVKVSTVGGVKVFVSASVEQNAIEAVESLMFNNTGTNEGYLKFVPSLIPGQAGTVSFQPAVFAAPEFIDGGGADADNPN